MPERQQACGFTTGISVTTSTRRSSTVLGFMSPGVVLLSVVGLGLFTFIPGAVASNPTESLGSVLGDAAILAAAAALVALASTARLAVAGSQLRVTNLFQTITVEASDITKIDISRGLVIVTADGRRIRSFAYGASLAGDLLGYRRSRAAQGRCEAWLSSRRHGNPPSQDDKVVVNLRPAMWLLPAGFLAAYVAEVLVVRALS